MLPCGRAPRRRLGRCLWLGAAAGRALGEQVPCIDWFMAPAPPRFANALNGVEFFKVCFNATPHLQEMHHVFVIGDWGGLLWQGSEIPVPADKRSRDRFPAFARDFVDGVDDTAQLRVAAAMRHHAELNEPDYILNVGDSFYWGGIDSHCGAPAWQHTATGQWTWIFENVYKGRGIDGKQWLGVLGNHDYGGYSFTSAWDQVIAYTWGGPHSTGRWVMPAQYWKAKVHYHDFSIDYYFVDTNVFTTFAPDVDVNNNICSGTHNPADASCGDMGPRSLTDCPAWFQRLWQDQIVWVEHHLPLSTATWQIVVTHLPPEWGSDIWERWSRRYGIDLILSGHKHLQEVWAPTADDNPLRPTAVVVSGGGGGITSEGLPLESGEDNMYGFVDLALTRESVVIRQVSHGGQVRSTTVVPPRMPSLVGDAATVLAGHLV